MRLGRKVPGVAVIDLNGRRGVILARIGRAFRVKFGAIIKIYSGTNFNLAERFVPEPEHVETGRRRRPGWRVRAGNAEKIDGKE